MSDTDPIEEQAYCELLVSCQEVGCRKYFEESLKPGASDPVATWAREICKKARFSGWTSESNGKILCSFHSKGISR